MLTKKTTVDTRLRVLVTLSVSHDPRINLWRQCVMLRQAKGSQCGRYQLVLFETRFTVTVVAGWWSFHCCL